MVQGGYYPPMAPNSPPQGGIMYPQSGLYSQQPPNAPAQQQPYPVHQNAPVLGVQPATG